MDKILDDLENMGVLSEDGSSAHVLSFALRNCLIEMAFTFSFTIHIDFLCKPLVVARFLQYHALCLVCCMFEDFAQDTILG